MFTKLGCKSDCIKEHTFVIIIGKYIRYLKIYMWRHNNNSKDTTKYTVFVFNGLGKLVIKLASVCYNEFIVIALKRWQSTIGNADSIRILGSMQFRK